MLAVRKELAEVRQILGAALYQIGEELVVGLFSNISPPRYMPLAGQYQEVCTSYPPKPVHLPLQGFDSKGLHGGKRTIRPNSCV